MAASVSCMGSLRVQQRAPASGSVRCQAGLKAQGQPAKAVSRDQQQLSVPNKLAVGMLGAAAALSLVLGAPAHAAEPFLKSTGARGPLVAEEERVLQLLNDREAEVQKELKAVRSEYEEEVRKARKAAPDDQLCATPFGIDVVGITEFIALTGALVGGVSARRRKQELERLNEQLRTINTQFRQQARAGTLYAPGLTYAPTNNGSMPQLPDSMWSANNGAAAAAAELAATLVAPPAPPAAPLAAPAAPAAAAPSVLTPAVSLMSQDDEETGPEAAQCTQALKDGKRLLKEGNAGGAMVRFEKALMLAKATTDRVKERRATRGLAACARMQGQLRQLRAGMCCPAVGCRVAPSCNSAGFVANRLSSAPLHSQGGRTVVPLLHPQQHGLPFLLTLELHAAAPPAAAASAPPPAAALDRSLYALHYVLAGNGQLVRKAGSTEELEAGDAVLMHNGAAACHAGALPHADGSSGDAAAGLPADSPWQLAELVAYMPRQLFEQQGQQGQRQAVEQQARQQLLRTASLKPLLLPGGGGGEAASLPAEFLSALLAGARDTARHALAQQEHAPEPEPGLIADLTGNDPSSSSGPSSSPSSSSSSEHDGGFELPGALRQVLSTAATSLAAWWSAQQQRTCPVTKRTLAELIAFRLPNQTNRLAVQFDPYSRPQVPFISAIEVFERGHRTTPHVHPQAHEVFFILAGQGEGFCGEERFPVVAGDVVVFRPGSIHGIDNSDASRMYCLELMLPNEAFAEFVRTGEDTGRLSNTDMCVLAAIGCR